MGVLYDFQIHNYFQKTYIKYKNMLKGYYIEDKDIKYVELPRGEWLINNEPFSNTSYQVEKYQIQSLEDFNNIRSIHKKNEIDYVLYEGNKISGYEYNSLQNELLEYCDSDGDWDNIDKEYEYKKLLRDAQTFFKSTEIISEPHLVEIKKFILDSSNPYIKSLFYNGDERGLFQYNAQSCWLDTVSNEFNKLGFEFNPKADYRDTKNKKIWSNSTHSVIKYVCAFGAYIFSDEKWSKSNNYIGTLEDCKNWYEKDTNEIKDIIKRYYNVEYGEVNSNKLVRELNDKIFKLYNAVYRLNVHKSDNITKQVLLSSIKEMEDIFTRIVNESN